MSNIKLLIVFGLVVAGSCSFLQTVLQSHNKGRIVNGQDALSGQFPYFVLLEHFCEDSASDSESSNCCSENCGYISEICGGALIGIEWVLTAAHCVIDIQLIDVYLGSIDDDCAKEGYTIPSDKISIHPDYKRETLEHDIALIRIPKTTVCDTVNIVPLPKLTASAEYSGYAFEYAFISGFGMINSEEYAERLQWARLLIIDNKDCAKYSKDFKIIKDKICAQSFVKLASSSFGDSGSPLVLESTGELVGVTVAVSKLGTDKGLPILFARVTNYLEWIKSVAGIYNSEV